jgi:twitching motility two-component system response regulator PilH
MSRVLIVEDSPTVSSMLAYMLGQIGHETVTAIDGQEAVHLAEKLQPQLILLDVILPKLNGYQVCRQLKATPNTAQIPVVMITSKSRDSDRLWGIEQGADDYITKPVQANDLRTVIDRFLSPTENRP